MATAANVYRDYETDGVPASGAHKVKEIRELLAGYENIINAFTSNGGLIYVFKSTMDGDLDHPANVMAWVVGDPVAANNGTYKKLGGTGSGSWTRVADLPFSFIIASDAGAGTANAIQATTSIPVSSSALVWMNIFEANTASPVTVSFNGGSTLTIKTNSGNDIAAGGLVAGMTVAGIISGSTFRLLSDQVSAAVVAAAEAAQAAAEAAAVSVNIKNVATRTALKALNTAVTTLVFLGESGRDGLFTWKSGDYSVQIAADTQEGLYIKANAIPATSGAWVRQGGWAIRGVIPEWFGAVGDGVADDTVALEAVVNIGMHAEFGRKSYITTRKLVPKNGVHWNGHGGVPILEFGTPSGYFQDSATKILLKGTGLKEHTIAGATSRSVANPDVGAPYLADSGTRGNTYRNVDWTVAFSAGIIIGSGCRINGIGVYPYFDGVDGYKGTGGRLSDDWDVGIWSRNGDWAGGEDTIAYGHFRKAALLMSSHDLGDGRIPSAESQRWIRCKFQGYWGVSIRSPEVVVGSNWGFADSVVENCDIRSLMHQSGHLATSSALATPFAAPSGCLDIAGGTMARVNIFGGRRMGYDDICDFFGNADEILFDGVYAEAKPVKVSGSDLANSQGARMVATSDLSLVIYRNNRKFATDLSPKKPRDVALPGRYTIASAGVFNPSVCIDDDSDEQRFASFMGPKLSAGQGWRVNREEG